ncbi:MAG: thiamine phosphate synthase [Candidatus Eremiobacteraeota bacterium]|nr:thiamine phosphate synthase [Candidatus Eremiobacteraeota bacterium]
MRVPLRGIYAIVDAAEGEPLAQLEAILAGGVRIVQYRAKDGVAHELVAALRRHVHDVGGCLIVNDHAHALELADGLHLGQEDLALHDFTGLRRAHPDKILGLSCPDVLTAHAAESLGADYIGAGSIYATSSKSDAGAPIGPQGVRAIVEAVSIPVAAVGGIRHEDLAEVRATGAAMAAVIRAISRAPDARAAAAALVAAWGA